MNDTDKYIARIIFKNKILESNGNTFENFFTKIMGYHNSDFSPVKPQGQIGDRSNDGFDRISGKYYQVYAPEDITKNYSTAVSKLQSDFQGLNSYWQPIAPIQEFYFVINDKYLGAYPTLETELANIKSNHTLNHAAPLLAKDLEKITFDLNADQIYSILGYIPNIDNLGIVKIASINNVVHFLFESRKPTTQNGKLVAPDFHEKIEFNGLSTKTGSLLNVANYQTGLVDTYFENNGDLSKDHLRDIFSNLYIEARDKLKDDNEDKSDKIFFNILECSCPEKVTKEYQDAILILMSYFFESCDIFEEPTGV